MRNHVFLDLSVALLASSVGDARKYARA